MRLKSAYREKPELNSAEPAPAENIPAVESEGEPVDVHGLSVEIPGEVEPDDAIDAAVAAATKADQAKYALVHQIESLRQSEALQRQHQAAMMAAHMARQHPPSREQKLEMWKAQGVGEAEINFLRKHPAMIDHEQVTAQAIGATVQSGIRPDSPEFLHAVKANFHAHMKQLQAQGTATAPEFFRPPPLPEPPGPASYVSAPVSRSSYSAASGERHNPSSSRVTLSPDELMIAKASGITATQYAANKLRLAAEKKSGQRQ